MRHTLFLVSILLTLLVACNKRGGASESANTVSQGLECDHDVGMGAVADHAWPYPAELRDLRWVGGYEMAELRLKPSPAAFITATIGFRDGDLIRVLDSRIRITKPRRLVAKRDLLVTRTVWSQGVEVQQTELAVAKGEVGNFLFYNSEGLCIIGTSQGPGWTECTLDDAFEGLSAENPYACQQTWWIKLQKKRKVDTGWMVVDPARVERVPGATVDAAK